MMSFFSEYLNVILFYSAIVLLVYVNRNRFEKQAAFMYLYKTKFGLKFMDDSGKKFGSIIRFLGYIGIIVAYAGFFLVTYALLNNAYDLIINKPGAVGGSPVIPGLPIAGLGIKFPLIIGWISLFIIMIVHEFAHGMVARAHNVKVKSSGIAFFGPILGAFVEPDEKEISKKPHKVQHSIFAAGPFSNVLLWLVCLGLLFMTVPFTNSFTLSQGVKIGVMQENLPAFEAGIKEGAVITGINNDIITNISSLEKALQKIKPGEELVLKTRNETYELKAAKNPNNETRAYLGIWLYGEEKKLKDESKNWQYKIMLWIIELLTWTGFISINIGLINLFPIFITDGARMLKLNFDYIFKKKGFEYWKTFNMFSLFIILIIIFLPMLRSILSSLVSLF